MHRPSRHLIVVTLMTVALCADRPTPSTTERPATIGSARRIVDAIALRFRRVATPFALQLPRLARPSLMPLHQRLARQAQIHNVEGLPFFFRLPPPTSAA